MSDPRHSVMVMNLPKRLSGRRSRTETPGHVQEADEAGRDPEQTAYLSWVATTVERRHGWAISGRHGDEAAPPWAFSVGMWLTCQAPELVLCGLSVENAAAIINAVGARVADGADYGPGDVLDDVCPAPLAFRPVDPGWRATGGLLSVANAFYGMVRPPYLQVVWSDREGRFPWDQGHQSPRPAGRSRCCGSPATTTRRPRGPAWSGCPESGRVRQSPGKEHAKMMPMSSPGTPRPPRTACTPSTARS